jgi:hypothetical protein
MPASQIRIGGAVAEKHTLDVAIQKDETGGYIAFVPSLPGYHTQGETLEELMKNVEEAIELYQLLNVKIWF